MPPDDPLGRHGPSLENFLRKRPTAPDHPPQICPYGKKCTYGNKCKYYHPERQGAAQKSISEILKEQNESRRRSELVKALLDDRCRDDHTPPKMHKGYFTEPIMQQQQSLDSRRQYFLERFGATYGEENIRSVFAEQHPRDGDFNEQHVHQRLRQFVASQAFNDGPRADRVVVCGGDSPSSSGRGDNPGHVVVVPPRRADTGIMLPTSRQHSQVRPPYHQHHHHHQGAANNLPPPHIHHAPEGHFYSQPLPRQPMSHEERFRSMGPPGNRPGAAAAMTGNGRRGSHHQERNLQEMFERVSLGDSSAVSTAHHAR